MEQLKGTGEKGQILNTSKSVLLFSDNKLRVTPSPSCLLPLAEQSLWLASEAGLRFSAEEDSPAALPLPFTAHPPGPPGTSKSLLLFSCAL